MYLLWHNLFYDVDEIVYKVKHNEFLKFKNEKLFFLDYNLTRKELILLLKDIQLHKNYDLLTLDYTKRETDLINLISTYNLYSENYKKNIRVNNNIINMIHVEKYKTKDERLELQTYQILIITIIFSILSSIIIIDLFTNRKKYWNIIKNI